VKGLPGSAVTVKRIRKTGSTIPGETPCGSADACCASPGLSTPGLRAAGRAGGAAALFAATGRVQ